MKTVRIFDFKTRRSSTIPESELAPGMVQAEVRGVGVVWVSAESMQREKRSIKHPPFTKALREKVRRHIQEPLKDVCPKSLEDWEADFRRDENVEQEIAVWYILAERFDAFCKQNPLTGEQRQECFEIMMNCTMASTPDQVFATVTLQALTREQARDAMRVMRPDWKR